MRRTILLSVLQLAVLLCLFIIGATTFYALSKDRTASAAIPIRIDGGGIEDPIVATIPLYKEGRTVWNASGCGTCHVKNMRDVGTGPALGGVTDRWAAEPRAHLHAWIKNSVALANSGVSPRAAMMVDWSVSSMSMYNHLDSTDIEALLAYIDGQQKILQ